MSDGTERPDDGPERADVGDLDGVDDPQRQPDEVDRDGGGSAGRRLFGALAMVLAAIGMVASLVLAVLALRLLFTASGTADRAFEPVQAAFDRLEERIDQTDDLVSAGGVEADQVDELRARVDGLVDVAALTSRGIEAVDRNPFYRLLPADLSPASDALEGFEDSAAAVDEALGRGTTVRPAAAATMASELDGMQARVTDTRDRFDGATSSLRSWLRLGGLLGFLGSLWLLWAQRSLLRRGWRGFRNQPL